MIFIILTLHMSTLHRICMGVHSDLLHPYHSLRLPSPPLKQLLPCLTLLQLSTVYREPSPPLLRVPPVTQHPKVWVMAEGDIPGDKAPPDTLHIPPMTTDLPEGLTKKEEVAVEAEAAVVQVAVEEGEKEEDLEMDEDLAVDAEDHGLHHPVHHSPHQPALVAPMTTRAAHPVTDTATGAWEGQVTVIYILIDAAIDHIARTIHKKTSHVYRTLAISRGSGTEIFRFWPIFSTGSIPTLEDYLIYPA